MFLQSIMHSLVPRAHSSLSSYLQVIGNWKLLSLSMKFKFSKYASFDLTLVQLVQAFLIFAVQENLENCHLIWLYFLRLEKRINCLSNIKTDSKIKFSPNIFSIIKKETDFLHKHTKLCCDASNFLFSLCWTTWGMRSCLFSEREFSQYFRCWNKNRKFLKRVKFFSLEQFLIIIICKISSVASCFCPQPRPMYSFWFFVKF